MEWLGYLVGLLILGSAMALVYFVFLSLGYSLLFEQFKSQGKDDSEADRLAWVEINQAVAYGAITQSEWF